MVVGRGTKPDETEVRTALENLTVLSVTPQPEQSSQGQNLPVVTLLAKPCRGGRTGGSPIPAARVRLDAAQSAGRRHAQPRLLVARERDARRRPQANWPKIVSRIRELSMILASSLAFFLVIFLLGVDPDGHRLDGVPEDEGGRVGRRAKRPRDCRSRGQQPAGASREGRELGFRIESSPCCTATVSAPSRSGTPAGALRFRRLAAEPLDQAQLDWSVGRITSMMLLIGAVAWRS